MKMAVKVAMATSIIVGILLILSIYNVFPIPTNIVYKVLIPATMIDMVAFVLSFLILVWRKLHD